MSLNLSYWHISEQNIMQITSSGEEWKLKIVTYVGMKVCKYKVDILQDLNI